MKSSTLNLITQIKRINCEKHNLPKLTQDQTDDINRPIVTKEAESIINNPQ